MQARLLSHLVNTFDLPLSILKRIDMSELVEGLVLFLATFFIAFLSSPTSDETFQKTLDRVATTKDFALARDNILFYLQVGDSH